jgi:hypothetical protein
MRLKITIGGIWLRQLVLNRTSRSAALASLLVFFHDSHAAVDIGADSRPGGSVLQLDEVLHSRIRRNFCHAEHRLIGIFLLQPAEDGHRQVLLRIIPQRVDEIAIPVVLYFGKNVVLFKVHGVLFPLFGPDYLLRVGEGLFECLQQFVADGKVRRSEDPGGHGQQADREEETLFDRKMRCHDLLIY